MNLTSFNVLLGAVLSAQSVLGVHGTELRLPKRPAEKSVETTITALVNKSAIFRGKRVRVSASYHSDGIHHSVLMEPNCGRPAPDPKTPPTKEPDCGPSVVPVDSEKAANDAGSQDLDRALAQNPLLGTMDKHITAEFTGKFRCVPSCESPKYFVLEIERVENLKVEMKNMKPHWPE